MARSWRDYASAPRANSANSAESSPIAPIVANVTNGTALPVDVANGLARLRSVAVPRWCDPEQWAAVRADAERLASDGWATKALALGWSLLDLFGAANRGGDPYADGLAVWMRGRSIRVLTADYALAVDNKGNRFFCNRPRAAGARLLWALSGNG